MYFKRDRFSGIAPGVTPRLLADQFAQTAENIDFESGRLAPTTVNSSSVFTLANGARRSIFYYRSTNWLQWNADNVKAVPGPIPNDTNERLYFSGDSYPKMGTIASMISGSSGYPAVAYRLGVPAAAAAPSVSKSGSIASAETPEDRSYVYTFVTAYGEEGPPSPASTVLQVTSTEAVAVSMPANQLPGSSSYTGASDFNMGSGALKRIYRSNTGSNFTNFQFVAEVAIGTNSYADQVPTTSLGEVLPSGTWIGPPDDNASLYPDGQMLGLCSVGNGVFAGFSGKRFCLSEPYLPHAWPIDYRITLEEDIVGIAATGNGLVALTEGTPYFITGTDPSAMTPIQVDLAQACINTNSIVDMGAYVLYAAPDGLVAVTGTTGEVVTKGLISSKQWGADFNPTIIRAFRHEETYVAFYNNGGTLGGWVFDPRSQEASLSTLTVAAEVRGGYHDPKDGQLYIIEANTVKKYQGGSSAATLTWKSKKFVVPNPISMAWVSVDAASYPVTVRVWADETLIANYTLSKSGSVYTQATTTPSSISNGTLREPIMRLPSALAKEWEVEVSGAVSINEVCLAQSMDEIREL
jgi:hypothetical protein